MPTAQAAPALTPKLKIEGTAATEELMRLLTELVVDDSVHLPDVCELTFADFNAGLLESSPFKIGAKIKVELTAPGQPPSTFEGECVSIGARYHGGKFQSTIRAFDVSHRLNRGRMTKTFEEMTATDVFRNVIGEFGVTAGTVESTTVTFPHLSIVNEAPFPFLRRLAAEHGLEAVAADNKMHFRKPESKAAPISIEVGGSILSLDVEVTGADQVKDVKVTGWDARQKKAVEGKAAVQTKAAKLDKHTPETLSQKMGKTAKLVIGDLPIEVQAHANAVATATAEQAGSAFVDLRATLSGHTGLRAGGKIKLEGVGRDLQGEYTLSNTRHVWSQAAGYTTEITVSGQQDRSLGGLIHGAGGGSGPTRSLSGVVTGIVTDNKDPDNVGRVRVALPWLDAEHVSGWARVAYPGGGADRGITFLPEVNDEVLVAFHHGDPGRPFVVGGLYNGKDKFPDHKGASHVDRGKTNHYGLFTDKHKLTFADKAGAESIELGLRDKSYMITLDKKGTVISIGSDGKVDIKAKSGVTISAQQGNIELVAKAGDVKIGGLNVAVEGKAGLTLSATGAAKLKGATVAIG